MEFLTVKETLRKRQLESLSGPRLVSYKKAQKRLKREFGLLYEAYEKQLIGEFLTKLDKKLRKFYLKLVKKQKNTSVVNRNTTIKDLDQKSLNDLDLVKVLTKNPLVELERIAAVIKTFKLNDQTFSLKQLHKIDPTIPINRFRYQVNLAVKAGKLVGVRKRGKGGGSATIYKFAPKI